LVVVLLVMMALLGMGLVGLYLTSGSIQMNANINMRNQALFVAESGINRAKSVLNRTIPGLPAWSPNLAGMLAGTTSPTGVPVTLNLRDDIPNDPVYGCQAADGVGRGAYLRDEPGTVTGCASNSGYIDCAIAFSDNPSDPNAPPVPTGQIMGTYTLFIRQDLADCRTGNFTCDGDPSNPNPNCPTANGIVVIRSEGTASDNRTRVVLEVTMARNPNATFVEARLATVCPAGQAGCDDNASVQQGITVAGVLSPPTAGTTGSAGASGSAGSSGSGGSTGGSAGAISTSPLAGNGGGVGGTIVGGSSVPSGGAGGSSSGCQSLNCPILAVMGVYSHDNRQPSRAFSKWLNEHVSDCAAQDLDVENNVITDAMLAPYKSIIVLDVGHNLADYDVLNAYKDTDPKWFSSCWGPFSLSATARRFSAAEGEAIRKWVSNGGGLLVTNGYDDTLRNQANFNTVVHPLGLTYFSPSCGLTYPCPAVAYWQQDEYGNNANYGGVKFTTFSFAFPFSVPGMTAWFLSGYWPIAGWNEADTTHDFKKSIAAPVPGASYIAWANHYPGNSGGPVAPHNIPRPYNIGVAGTYYSGRVVAVADDFLTYDSTMLDNTYKASLYAFWNYALKWIGQCP
jgi:hypothetical protein